MPEEKKETFRPTSAPVNPSTRGTYLIGALVLFAVIVAAVYYSYNSGTDATTTSSIGTEQVEPAPEVGTSDNPPVVEPQTGEQNTGGQDSGG